jgi:hypothetical protein
LFLLGIRDSQMALATGCVGFALSGRAGRKPVALLVTETVFIVAFVLAAVLLLRLGGA